MTDIAIERLYNQQVIAPRFAAPGELVTWMGAIQAQETWGGKWTIGLRLPGSVEADIDAALADKGIVRAFFMRGTLHYVPGADIRWMTPLVSERVRRLIDSTSRYNKTGLDEAAFRRAQDVLVNAMLGGRQLTRTEVKQALCDAGIQTSNVGYMFLLQRAQIDGLVCYGTDRGKQPTFVLLDEWLPPAPLLDRAAGLAEFARRFFLSHGPATVHDFAKWSGLPMADAKAGLAAIRGQLSEETIGGSTYCFAATSARPPRPTPDAHLLPTYDEFLIGYKDRSASISEEYGARWAARTDHNVSPLIVDGRTVGVWRRELKKQSIVFHLEPFEVLRNDVRDALFAAAKRYGDFLNLDTIVV